MRRIGIFLAVVSLLLLAVPAVDRGGGISNWGMISTSHRFRFLLGWTMVITLICEIWRSS